MSGCVRLCPGMVREQDYAFAFLALRHTLTPVSHFWRNMETLGEWHSPLSILIPRHFQNVWQLIPNPGPLYLGKDTPTPCRRCRRISEPVLAQSAEHLHSRTIRN